MALGLSLSISQSNDATYLTVTDDTGVYDAVTNDTGWGAPNEVVTDIVADTTTTALKIHLLLDIIVTDKNGDSTTYDTINLYDHDTTGPFADVTDLTWVINASDLVSSSTAMGLSTDRLTDGVWDITYTAQDANTGVAIDTYSVSNLIDGNIRADVYDALREITRQYDDNINDESKEIMESLLKYAFLQSINAAASVSEQDELVNMLWTLDKLNSDGSKYAW